MMAFLTNQPSSSEEIILLGGNLDLLQHRIERHERQDLEHIVGLVRVQYQVAEYPLL